MSIEVKDFDTMVNDVLRRITNSTNISNTNPGSVIRTIVESLMAEQDIQYYQINKIFDDLGIDTATGTDLDRLVKILNVVRKSATACVTTLTFGRTSALEYDVPIPFRSTVSTYADRDGKTIEFVVTEENAYLPAGELSVDVECAAKIGGVIYVPANVVGIMNTPILSIEYVNNKSNIYGGSDTETDDELRKRAKSALTLLGKGTVDSLVAAVMDIEGVQDAICVDLARGVGTADMIIVTAVIPPTNELRDEIEATIDRTKSAGIDVQIVYPTVITVDINVTTTNFTNADVIGNGILKYILSLGVGDMLIINQLERYIINECRSDDMDVAIVTPSSNVEITSTQIARNGTITINGVVWDG